VISFAAVKELGTIDVYVNGDDVVSLDRYEAMGVIAELTAAMSELWPEPEPGWNRDPNREDLSGRIGKKQARDRSVRKR
jgi:hypothetical protein